MKERYIITQTVEEQFKVLQLLEKLGYMWYEGKKATEIVPIADFVYYNVIYFYPENKKLSYGGEGFVTEYDAEEITYEELLKQSKKVIL